jgi:hypothetical protein
MWAVPSSFIGYVVAYRKAGGERTSNIAAHLLRRPPHPRSLTLESLRGNIHHGLSEATLGFVSQGALALLDGRERRPRAQARQGQELLPEREGRLPPQDAHWREAHPGQAGCDHPGG